MRLLHIQIVFLKHGLDELVFSIKPLRPIRFILYFFPWHWGRKQEQYAPRGVRIRLVLEELGPVYIKLGQMLSTRRDLMPEDIATELAKLQDRVPPFPGEKAIELVEKAYGHPLHHVFTEFNPIPLASASIAQVHTARLLNNLEVVVKVVRPNIQHTIRRDIDLMYIIADLLERYWQEGKRLRLVEVVSEYEKTTFDELDLIQEAANASQIKRNFKDYHQLYIPEVYWDYSRRNVMVMERIRGIPVNDTEQLKRFNVNLKRLSEVGVEIFFTQVFKHNFFHADMHPGNIFVSYEHTSNPQYIAIDFGIVGTLSPDDQRYLAENFVAFFNRNYRRVAELHIDSGWVPSTTRIDQLESAIRTVCEPIFQRPIRDISFGQLLLRLFQIARRFDMQVQPQLVLLQKTLLNIEGLGRQLDPDLDLWATAKPFLERWMSEQMGPHAFIAGIQKNIPFLTEKLPELPDLFYKTLKQISDKEMQATVDAKQFEKLRQEVRAASKRTLKVLAAGALLISTGVLSLNESPQWWIWIITIGAGFLIGKAWGDR